MGIVMGPDNVREETLRRLMNQHKNDLMRMCCVFLKDQALAEDAVQETFVKAYKAMDTFRGDSSEKNVADAHCHQHMQNHAPGSLVPPCGSQRGAGYPSPEHGGRRGSRPDGRDHEPSLQIQGGCAALLLSRTDRSGNVGSLGCCRFNNIHEAEKSRERLRYDLEGGHEHV